MFICLLFNSFTLRWSVVDGRPTNRLGHPPCLAGNLPARCPAASANRTEQNTVHVRRVLRAPSIAPHATDARLWQQVVVFRQNQLSVYSSVPQSACPSAGLRVFGFLFSLFGPSKRHQQQQLCDCGNKLPWAPQQTFICMNSAIHQHPGPALF